MFNYSKFPTLETERLILREMLASDAHSIFAIRSDYEVTKHNIGAAYTNLSQAEKLINAMAQDYREKTSVRWGITIKPNNDIVGMTGFNYWNQTDNRASIGFDLAHAHWRKGIMREAVVAMLNFGFQQMALHRIEADASIYNEPSISFLRSLGFQQEGIQRDQYYEDNQYHNLVLFSLLEHEWKYK